MRLRPNPVGTVTAWSGDPSGLPLQGVRVVDFTRLLPGAFCTLMMADMGADVIKVEAPDGGDPMRAVGAADGSVSPHFSALNRNKRSLTLDLRAGGAGRVLDALIDHADVVVESFRPETSRRFQLDASSVLAKRPRLIHCALTGFGQTGPYANRAGHDINYVALSGLLALDGVPVGRPDEPDRIAQTFVADIGGGAMSATMGILAALFRRERTGQGASVDVSMHDGALAWLTFPAATAVADTSDGSAAVPPLGGLACYGVYTAQDGLAIALGALEPKFWNRFCQRVGRPEWQREHLADATRQVTLRRAVADLLASRPRSEWLRLFDGVNACLSPVNSIADALRDPQAVARGTVTEDGDSRYLRSPVRLLGGTPLHAIPLPAIRRAPALGADTDTILDEIGLSSAVLDKVTARTT